MKKNNANQEHPAEKFLSVLLADPIIRHNLSLLQTLVSTANITGYEKPLQIVYEHCAQDLLLSVKALHTLGKVKTLDEFFSMVEGLQIPSKSPSIEILPTPPALSQDKPKPLALPPIQSSQKITMTLQDIVKTSSKSYWQVSYLLKKKGAEYNARKDERGEWIADVTNDNYKEFGFSQMPNETQQSSSSGLKTVSPKGILMTAQQIIDAGSHYARNYIAQNIRKNKEIFSSEKFKNKWRGIITLENYHLVGLPAYPQDLKKNLEIPKTEQIQKKSLETVVELPVRTPLKVKSVHLNNEIISIPEHKMYSVSEVVSYLKKIHSDVFSNEETLRNTLEHLQEHGGYVEGKNLADFIVRTNGMLTPHTRTGKKLLAKVLDIPEKVIPELLSQEPFIKYVKSIDGVVNSYLLKENLPQLKNLLKENPLAINQILSRPPESSIINSAEIHSDTNLHQYIMEARSFLAQDGCLPYGSQYQLLVKEGILKHTTQDEVEKTHLAFREKLMQRGYETFNMDKERENLGLDERTFHHEIIISLIKSRIVFNIREDLNTKLPFYVIKRGTADYVKKMIKNFGRNLAQSL